MGTENFFDKYLLNGQIIPADLNEVHKGQRRIYEVIRTLKSYPVFLKDHIKRLQISVEKAGLKNCPNDEVLLNDVYKLININNLKENNIEICLIYSTKDKPDILVKPLPHHYPSADEYLYGVSCSLLFDERDNPTVKEQGLPVRQKADIAIKDKKIYEAILVNKQNQITEGSRSNIFFIQKDTVISAEDSLVLGGITRMKIIDILAKKGIPFIYKALNINELKHCDAAFISGTSPKVLAIKNIENYSYNVKHPLLSLCMEEYNQLIINDVKNT